MIRSQPDPSSALLIVPADDRCLRTSRVHSFRSFFLNVVCTISLTLSCSLSLFLSLPLTFSLTLVLRYVSLRIPERALREGRVPPGGCDPSSLTVPSFAIYFWFLGFTGSRRALMSPRTTKSKSHATSWFNRAAAGSSASWSTPVPGRPASRSLCRWTFSSSVRCPCHPESPWRILLAFVRPQTWSCSAPANSNETLAILKKATNLLSRCILSYMPREIEPVTQEHVDAEKVHRRAEFASNDQSTRRSSSTTSKSRTWLRGRGKKIYISPVETRKIISLRSLRFIEGVARIRRIKAMSRMYRLTSTRRAVAQVRPRCLSRTLRVSTYN